MICVLHFVPGLHSVPIDSKRMSLGAAPLPHFFLDSDFRPWHHGIKIRQGLTSQYNGKTVMIQPTLTIHKITAGRSDCLITLFKS